MSTGALSIDIQFTPTRGFMLSRADSFVKILMWSRVLDCVPVALISDGLALGTESNP